MPPRIIHMIYFPWGKDQKLLPDCHDFDHRPHENMVRYASGFDVRLWTFDRARSILETHDPAIWKLMMSLARPTMMVDVFRWWLVHHFGGIYWQYDMNPLVGMEHLMPGPGKAVRLFTENLNDAAFCRAMADEPIRGGEPEESVRLCNQVFSAAPGHRFIKAVLDLIVDRSSRLTPKRDYDILYICANAAVSTVYDQLGKTDPEVELLDRTETRRRVKLQYKGTWRTESPVQDSRLKVKDAEKVSSSLVPGSPRRSALAKPGSWLKKVVKRVPGYYNLKPHAHERAGLVVTSVLPTSVFSWAADGQVQSLAIFPYQPSWEETIPREKITRIWRLSLSRLPAPGVAFFNPMHMRWPKADAVACLDYMERLPNNDIEQVWVSIRKSSARYVMFSHHPELNNNWDTALGDQRPLNWSLPPWSLGKPEWSIPWPSPDGRPDRVVAVWKL